MRAIRHSALAVVVLVPATVWAQVGGPVQPGDVAIGLSRFEPTETAPLLRGGALVGDWTQTSFLQSMEFDNLNGLLHNASGNLLCLNFGATATGGGLHNLATDGTDMAEVIWLFDGNQGNLTRTAGLSVSPSNTQVAVFGYDDGSLYILDYVAGSGGGSGASITGVIEATVAFIPNSTQGTTWLDADSVLLYRLDLDFGVNITELVQADIQGGNVNLTVRVEFPVLGAGSQYMDVEYNPAIAPWVICSHSSFAGGTQNTLTFVDPSTWEVVHAIELSTSLQTAREIALGADLKLYMGAWGGSGSNGPTIETLNLDTDNNGVVDNNDLAGITDNSTVDYFFFNDPNRESAFNGLDVASTSVPIILSNGDFDGLPVDTRPDCENNAGAGAWSFGTSYVQAGVCEASPEQFSIAATTSFDPGAKGNSLHLLVVNEPASNFHLPNRFNVVLPQGDPVTVAFDIWVVSGGGGSVYVGGDHGGGGYDAATDRGPQLTWNSNQQILASFGGQDPIVVPAYPYDAWQSVRMEIDLVADTFRLFWGPRGGPLSPFGGVLGFRSGTQDMLDRFTVMNFGGLTPDTNAYFDNVSVTLSTCLHDPCDMNCDGTVDATDIEFFIDILFNGAIPCDTCTGDTNGDGRVDAADIEGFINCLFP